MINSVSLVVLSRRAAFVFAALIFAFHSPSARAEVKMPVLFSDHMVLQQGTPASVWGWADDGEEVTVSFAGQKVSTKAAGGKWLVKLKPLKASSAGDTLTIKGKNTIEFKDVLVGEVWIASGQSNMSFALNAATGGTNDIASSTNFNLRLFYVPRLKANEPQSNIGGLHHNTTPVWMISGPNSTPDFSAVAYYFGRDLQKSLTVPVGVIHTSWGGSPAEAWIGHDALAANAEYQRDVLDAYPKAVKAYEVAKQKFDDAAAEAKKEGKKDDGKKAQAPRVPWKPSELYNSMIVPLTPFAIKGAIWYQGESNAGRAWQYRTLFADMIKNWRKDWGNDFTFLTVELAPFMKILSEPTNSTWGELREAQILASKNVGQAATVTITDVGEELDIHPKKKEPVGARLALQARKLAYGEKIIADGPTFKSVKFDGDKAIVSFDHVGKGLEARDGELKGFTIASEDQKFVWAKAEIKGETIVVSSDKIAKPTAVRFGWANYPVVNFWNKDGLPAHPFRTDDFPWSTFPKPVAKK